MIKIKTVIVFSVMKNVFLAAIIFLVMFVKERIEI
jgi:hypothetical protein